MNPSSRTIHLCATLATLACVLFHPPATHADEPQSRDTAVAMLTRGSWEFHGVARVFKLNGTWTSKGNPNHGNWVLTATTLDVDFASGASYKFALPLDPKGTAGLDHEKGLLYRDGEKPRQPTPKSDEPNGGSDISTDAFPSPTPTILSGINQTPAQAAAVLEAGSWQIAAQKQSYLYTFSADGTYTFWRQVDGDTYGSVQAYSGTWAQKGALIVLTPKTRTAFSLKLPINPGRTEGIGEDGSPLLFTQVMANKPDGGAAPRAKGKKKKDADTPAESVAGLLGNPAGGAVAATPAASPAAQSAGGANPLTPAQLTQAYRDSLVFVTGAEGAGSGFIASINGKNYLVTNAHVAADLHNAAFKTLDGAVVQGGTPSVAMGEDIFCMGMPDGGKPFDLLPAVDTSAAIGDEVVVLGNAEGAGVINTITGKIVGIGPNLVEVDAPFVPGNSGSPIIHLKTGKVIGVATYLVTKEFDITTHRKLANPIVRRFGYRLDSIKQWQRVVWSSFYAQAAQMAAVENKTKDFDQLFITMATRGGAMQPTQIQNTQIRNAVSDWKESKGSHPSPEDAAQEDATFLATLKASSQADVTGPQAQFSYDYFSRELAQQKQIRDQMSAAFADIIREIGQ